MRTSVSREGPKQAFDNEHICHHRTLPRHADANSQPLCASPRGRALYAGGICADSTTRGRARPRPSTRGRRWRRWHTFLRPGAAYPSGRSWGWTRRISDAGRRSIRYQLTSSRHTTPWWLRGCCSLVDVPIACEEVVPASATIPFDSIVVINHHFIGYLSINSTWNQWMKESLLIKLAPCDYSIIALGFCFFCFFTTFF